MATATDILTLTQWFSPAYPVGAFAYSHGLEWTIDAGDVATAAQTSAWIEDMLRHGAGWNDALFLAAAYHVEAEDLAKIDATARAFAASSERLKETRLQGEAFCDVTAKVWATDLAGLTYPVAVGRAARLEGLPLDLTAQFYLMAFASNLAAVAMRLVPLGQTDGQKLIRDLTPLCTQIAEDARRASLDDLNSTSFLGDIAAMKHETQYSRIFRT
ncbi:urease accessory protein UreF [Tropicibacter sp. R16_0]|uniref:urease accessory protein UreF n=1 Tax=Tropicibacter sp. R16_0 TaxID=2821102 RepID=UPI001AD97321|nr:urease accessory UreF family protein [Tropicibacter sp. R16_0]MBO9452977.1 urease accessory protein UreF [Tropicibacter sp. R16_0]